MNQAFAYPTAAPDAVPSDWVTPVAWVVIGLLALLTWWLWRRQSRAFEREVRALAAQQGWHYQARDRGLERSGTLATHLRDSFTVSLGAPPLPAGRGILPRATNVVSGTRHGVAFTVYAYRYTQLRSGGKGLDWKTRHFHVAVAHMPVGLPPVTWAPQGPLTKISGLAGARDIQFESPDFNRAWYVSSANPRLAYAIFTPQYLEWIMRQEPVPFWFQLEGDQAVAIHEGLPAGRYVMPVVEILTGTVARIPRHVWQDYATSTTAPHPGSPTTKPDRLQ